MLHVGILGYNIATSFHILSDPSYTLIKSYDSTQFTVTNIVTK